MNKNMNNVETKSTKVNFRSIGPALMVVLTVILFSAFTQINKKAINEVCFTFDIGINNPIASQASNPANYSNNPDDPMVCLAEYRTLCGICFDESYFELDINGKPDFINNPLLKQIVEENLDATGVANKTILVPGTTGQSVTLHFRKFN